MKPQSPNLGFISSLDTMIITNSNNFFNINFNNSVNFELAINKLYSDLVNAIPLDQIICHNCLHHSWHFHAYYDRFIIFHSHKIKIRITRIICSVCGKTHAILIGPIIPYLSELFDDLIKSITLHFFLFEYPLCFYLKKKFLSCENTTYRDLVLFNSRNNTVLFYPT